MPTYTDARSENPFRYTKRQWWSAFLLLVAYIVAANLSSWIAPGPTILPISSGIAVAALFLEGIALWPAVLLASLMVNIANHAPVFFAVVFPIAATLQAIVGAAILRMAKVDPLFRRSRDCIYLLITVVLASFITPTIGTLTNLLSTALGGPEYRTTPWGMWYIATAFCLLIIVPFLLRWFAKPRFSRNWQEGFETIAVFVVLIGIDYALFIGNMPQVGGISLVYLLLVPLFWIALRLRPRFVTLSLLITSAFAITSVFIHSDIYAATFSQTMYQTELFLIVLASIFLIIVSLEEDRRLNANLMRSQLATLENAVARVSSESRAKNDFIAVLAHELRNPLAPIASSIELLKLNENRAKEEIETLGMMEDRMQTIRRLLDDLLDISRISEGKVTLKKEPVDLETVIRRAIVSTEHHLRDRHQILDVRCASKQLTVNGDPVRLEQVFSNLLTNASKYSNTGDTITLTVSKRDDRIAEIIIRDQGIGIEDSSLEHIFTPFHQLDHGQRSKKGLGIGLALVKNFVEMHEGRVEAKSQGKDHGSTFTVILPLSSTPERTESHATTDHGSPSHKSAGLSVLVVDDNDAAAWGIGKLLELRGCEIEYAYEGQQAIDKAAEQNFDVILLDVGLPDMDGYTVAKTLRARGFRGRLIALTGFSTEEARNQGRESGFEYYLVKPAGMADLRRVIPEIG